MNPFKICMIGCGSLSTHQHGPALKHYAETHPGTTLSGCCDLDMARAAAYRDAFGFSAVYSDLYRMLEREQPDAVCAVVPVPVTADVASGVLEAGFPVLMEKPPGQNKSDCHRIMNASMRVGRPAFVSFNRRHTPVLQHALKLRRQFFGDARIDAVEVGFFRWDRPDSDFSTTAIHGLDTARFIVGSDIAEADFTYQQIPGTPEHVVNVYVDCVFESGTHGHLAFCPMTGLRTEEVIIHARDHTLRVAFPSGNAACPTGTLQHFAKGQISEQLSGRELTGSDEAFMNFGFYDENRAFFDSLRGTPPLTGDMGSAVQSVVLADAIRHRAPHYIGQD